MANDNKTKRLKNPCIQSPRSVHFLVGKKVRPDPEMFAGKMPKVNKTRYVLFTFRQEIAMNLPGLRLAVC